MGPVSISRLSFGDEDSASEAARLLRSNGIRVESFGPEGSGFIILIRAGDADRAAELLDRGRSPDS